MLGFTGRAPKDLIKQYNLVPSEDAGWYKIPNSDWELYERAAGDLVDADWPKSHDFKHSSFATGHVEVDAYLYLGKKIKK